MILTRPGSHKRDQRQPEKQMNVCPQNRSGNVFHRMKQMMMVIPVNGNIDKTDDITDKLRGKIPQRLPVGTMGNFQFQHHDGNDNGNHSIAESF